MDLECFDRVSVKPFKNVLTDFNEVELFQRTFGILTTAVLTGLELYNFASRLGKSHGQYHVPGLTVGLTASSRARGKPVMEDSNVGRGAALHSRAPKSGEYAR